MTAVEVATILDLLGRDPDAALIGAAEHAEAEADRVSAGATLRVFPLVLENEWWEDLLRALARSWREMAATGHDDRCSYGPGVCECSRGDMVRVVAPVIRAYLAGARL